MKSYLTAHLAIALHAIIIALIALFSGWYVHSALSNVEVALNTQVEESKATLAELATITDRNGADALTERIITDCPRRTEFENLLNKLGNASLKELISAQQLFESCGSFYAERKALMVASMEREYERLNDTLALLTKVRDLTEGERTLTKWKELIDIETTRSNFLNEQLSIQSEIIRLLIEGGPGQGRIQELAKQAQNINESLTVIDVQIDALRIELI